MPSMIVKQKFIPTLKKIALAASAIIVFAQCSEEEIAPVASSASSTETAVSTASANVNASSFTVTGINTVYNTAKDCSTCTYVIAEDSNVVDAKALGVKPGDVVCLNSLYNYGDLELINIEGTSDEPVVITTVGNFEATPEGSEDATSNENAY
jgi:hypothetical protein